MNPYKVLGVNENATQDEIKTAYRELVKKYHPDKYQNNPLADLAEEKLREVNEAYDMLTKGASGSTGNKAGTAPEFQAIRREIDANNIAKAEAMLNAISIKNAEWIFLSGMISYKKGWYDDALSKITQAHNMDPANNEYFQAMNTIRNMGHGFGQQAYNHGYNSHQAAFCQALQCYCCADMCCDCI